MDEKKENSANRKSDSDIAYAMIMKMKALNARKVLDQSSEGEIELEKDNAPEIIEPEKQNTDIPAVIETAEKPVEKTPPKKKKYKSIINDEPLFLFDGFEFDIPEEEPKPEEKPVEEAPVEEIVIEETDPVADEADFAE